MREHLLHFTTPDAPKPAIERLCGKFMVKSQLGGSNMAELLLLRRVFTLVAGG